MNNVYEQLIIGAGFAGICMAIQLKQAGFNNFLIVERNAHLGGTWYDNKYPGAACDVESHLYSYSFEPNPDWSRRFSPQDEILKYIEHCAEKYGITSYIQFNTSIKAATFNETTGLWTAADQHGKEYLAQSLISCAGGLSQPSLPNIAGIEDFQGTKFHSAQWNQNYDLSNKTVGIIGTGASAIQIVPAIAPLVKDLQLFQRTPPWIMPKMDGPISNFTRDMFKALPFTRSFYRSGLYWFHEVAALGFTRRPGMLKLASKVASRFLQQSVPDESLRKKLTPAYTMGCKRVLLSNEYYPALLRKNVHLITEHIDRINAAGVKTKDGQQYNLDAIIFATGFQAAEGVVMFDVQGRKGLHLNEAWRNGAEAYLGTSVSGFPNFFLVIGPNTGLGHSSMILMIEAQVNYIMQAVQLLKNDRLKFVDIKPETQSTFNQEIQKKLSRSVWQSGGCTSWYQTKSGKNVVLWPDFTFTFMNKTKKFKPEKYELRK